MLNGDTKYKDMRGRQTDNRPNRVSVELHREITAFIDTFPKYQSHYGRADVGVEKVFFDPNLSKALLFKLFTEQQRERPHELDGDAQVASYNYFDRILTLEFPHVGFKQPHKDSCDYCDETFARLKIARQSGSQAEVSCEFE
jgi:hypothetical protein